MLFTGKGDDGTTTFFNSKERVSKSSLRTEALGAVDELNSLLGVLKVRAEDLSLGEIRISEIISDIQEGFFIIQATIAGAEKEMPHKKIEVMERAIQAAEQELPPITTFFVSGGTELGAFFDFSRAVSRRAERRVLAWKSAEGIDLHPDITVFLNRVSSVLYAFARYANFRAGVAEKKPKYT